jgi:hypothetical protein
MPKAKSKAKTVIPRRLALFGRPLLLRGEDVAAYDGLFAGVYTAVKPVDTLEEMLVADVVALEWEVLRWRRLKSTLLRECEREALETFLGGEIDYNLYSEDFADRLASRLKDYLPEDQADTAEQLAHACAQNDRDAEDKIEEIFEDTTALNHILYEARAGKAKELAQKYVRREPDAVKLVDEILARAGVDLNDLVARQLGSSRIDNIERIDRLAAIAESRRNTSLREIDRRRAVLGEALRRSVKEVEDAEFQVVETMPTKGQIAP